MILYHGTNACFEVPDLKKCNPYKDFGRGFYLTPDIRGARRMAERAAERMVGGGGNRYVLVYEFDEDAADAQLKIRRFANPINEEFARFVMANRTFRTKAADHNRDNRYDLVVGPIANDKMGVLFRRFEMGMVSIENVVSELRYKRLTLQYSFHTAKALKMLRFKECRNV